MKTLAERVNAFINAEGHVTKTDTLHEIPTGINRSSRGPKYTTWSMHDDDTFLQLSCAMALEPVIFNAPLLRALWNCQAVFKASNSPSNTAARFSFVRLRPSLRSLKDTSPVFWRSISIHAKMLETAGLATKTDSGNLHFKCEGDRYVPLTYADDWKYIGIGATYRLPSGVRPSQALMEANDLTCRSQVIEGYVLPDRGVSVGVRASTSVFIGRSS